MRSAALSAFAAPLKRREIIYTLDALKESV
jgi:hypothetical protein